MTVPLDVLALAALVTVDRLVVPRVLHLPWAFLSIQALNAAGVVYVLGWGLPGIEHVWAVRWLVAALLVFHIGANLSRRAQARWERERDEAERRRWGERRPPPDDAA